MIDNHELGLPELFIIGDYIMIAITFAYLELREVAIKLNFEVFKLFSVYIRELKIEILLLDFSWKDLEALSDKINVLRVLHYMHRKRIEQGMLIENLEVR